MRSFEPIRLALIGFLLILIQIAWHTRFPHARAGIDFYLVFLLLLAATRGPALAGAFAIAGGAIMDSFSGSFIIFHLLFYLLPVALGSLVRSHMLTEYRFLGSLTVLGLLLAKILGQLIVALSMGWIDSPLYLFRVYYWPAVLTSLGVYLAWPWLVRLVPPPAEAKRYVG